VDLIAYKARALYHTDEPATIYLKRPDAQLTELAVGCRELLQYQSETADRCGLPSCGTRFGDVFRATAAVAIDLCMIHQRMMG